ncbi:MAG: LysM peptidoglycan-binding domain-containing protein [Candidatus Methylopumilus sp.]|nr:LysM peptidoglycan-binding domain-containing protein [Candidatus Methylopumilus sp.]
MKLTLLIIYIFLLSLVAGCASNVPAPVIEKKLPSDNKSSSLQKNKSVAKVKRDPNQPCPDVYVVKQGDTLFSISLDCGFYYKEVAQANDIKEPYTIKVGEKIKFNQVKTNNPVVTSNEIKKNEDVVTAPLKKDEETITDTQTQIKPTPGDILNIDTPKAYREKYADELYNRKIPSQNQPIKNVASPSQKENIPVAIIEDKVDWQWPAKGKLENLFNESAGQKGVDIIGIAGQEIKAAASGKVIYSGEDLKGYGKLVIIKHNNAYLSVYAHNKELLVKEGQVITKGQKIATMGDSGSDKIKLHFEIRKQGQSVDPTTFLGQP